MFRWVDDTNKTSLWATVPPVISASRSVSLVSHALHALASACIRNLLTMDYGLWTMVYGSMGRRGSNTEDGRPAGICSMGMGWTWCIITLCRKLVCNKHILHTHVTNTRLWQKRTCVCDKPLTETGEYLHTSAVSSYSRRVLPTRVRDKIKTRLCEEPYLRCVPIIRVCSKNRTTDDICKRVCVKKHSTNTCAIHASVLRSLCHIRPSLKFGP